MIPTTDRLRDELSLFSDVGTDVPVVHEDSRHVKVVLYRNGVRLSLKFDKHAGFVVESSNETDPVTRYPNYRALLASKIFADLRTWAGSQCRILRSSIDEARLLPVSGSMTVDTGNHAEKLGLFEQGSYALRPFFLSQLAGLGKSTEFLTTPPLIHLMNAMITREAGKFGDRVERVMDQEQREQFIRQVLVEAARDIAENQTESVDEEMLLWFVEMVLGDGGDDTIKRLLKNRILVLAFLVNDDRHGYRRFAHSEFYNYFLSHSASNAVRGKEVPKFLRRTILGADFLVSFGTVFESMPSVQAQTFLKVGQDLLSQVSNLDRSGRNIAALLLAALPVSDMPNGLEIVGANVDDAVIRGTAQVARISDSSINQFDLRGADISEVLFDSVGVSTLIADETPRLSSSFPDAGWIQLVSERSLDKTLDGARASDWIDRHGRRPMNVDGSIVPVEVKDHDLYKLLERACRVMLRHHWIRSPGDDREALLVRAPCWHELETLLIKWNLLTKEDSRQGGGRPSTFYHIKNAADILADNPEKEEVVGFLKEIVASIRNALVC